MLSEPENSVRQQTARRRGVLTARVRPQENLPDAHAAALAAAQAAAARAASAAAAKDAELGARDAELAARGAALAQLARECAAAQQGAAEAAARAECAEAGAAAAAAGAGAAAAARAQLEREVRPRPCWAATHARLTTDARRLCGAVLSGSAGTRVALSACAAHGRARTAAGPRPCVNPDPAAGGRGRGRARGARAARRGGAAPGRGRARGRRGGRRGLGPRRLCGRRARRAALGARRATRAGAGLRWAAACLVLHDFHMCTSGSETALNVRADKYNFLNVRLPARGVCNGTVRLPCSH